MTTLRLALSYLLAWTRHLVRRTEHSAGDTFRYGFVMLTGTPMPLTRTSAPPASWRA